MELAIASRPLPLWVARFYDPEFERMFRGSGLSGLGACPDGLYENVSHPGFCTNVPPAQQGIDPAAVAAVQTAVQTVAGSDPVIIQANNDARFGLQLTADAETQNRLIAEVQAQAAARGVSASCELVHNEAPAMGGLPASSLWQGLCRIGGAVDRDSAANILRTVFASPVAAVAANGPSGASPVPAGGGGGGNSSTPGTTSTPANTYPSATLPVDPSEIDCGDFPTLECLRQKSAIQLPGGISVSLPLLIGGGLLVGAFMFMGKGR